MVGLNRSFIFNATPTPVAARGTYYIRPFEHAQNVTANSFHNKNKIEFFYIFLLARNQRKVPKIFF
jgi:hypothetical protein